MRYSKVYRNFIRQTILDLNIDNKNVKIFYKNNCIVIALNILTQFNNCLKKIISRNKVNIATEKSVLKLSGLREIRKETKIGIYSEEQCI